MAAERRPGFVLHNKAKTVTVDLNLGGTFDIMIYYISKVFWLIAAPTSALILVNVFATFWALLDGIDIRGLVSSGGGLRAGHCSVHADRFRAHDTA